MRFLIYIGIYVVLNLFVGWNGYTALSHSPFQRFSVLYWTVFGVVTLAYVLSRIKIFPNWLKRLLKVIGSFYFAVFEFSLLLLIPVDIVAFILHLLRVSSQSYLPILSAITVTLLLLSLLIGSWYAWVPVVRTYHVEVEKRAANLKNLRILAASDIHLGNLVGNRHLRKLVARSQKLQPDIILLPGDVLDGDMEPFVRNHMADTLKQLQAPYGVFAVLGNHEYYEGQAAQFVKAAEDIGIRVLQDAWEHVAGGIYIVGRKDKTAESKAYGGGRMSWPELLAGVDDTQPIIAMDHQPLKLDDAQTAGVDVLLSGHTHRGQFAPNHWITRRLFEIDWGYLHKGAMHVFVSSGFGSWGPPIRIASQAEILDIHVRFV